MARPVSEFVSEYLRATTTDGRTFFGRLVCTNRDSDLILDEAYEKRSPDDARYLGMIVLRGTIIDKIALRHL